MKRKMAEIKKKLQLKINWLQKVKYIHFLSDSKRSMTLKRHMIVPISFTKGLRIFHREGWNNVQS